jgi:RNA polymerase sigma-70 factor, ECF subfamily
MATPAIRRSDDFGAIWLALVMISTTRRSSRMSAALIMAVHQNTSTLSFDALYRESARDLYAYVRTLLGDDASAEDVTALTFERAYRKRASFDCGRGSQRGWLFGIARNAALDELRRRKRSAPLVADLADDETPAPDEEADIAVRRSTVRVALTALAPRDRELIALKFHGGLSNAELAALLGTSESNVGTRVHRAVMKLREACNAPA